MRAGLDCKWLEVRWPAIIAADPDAARDEEMRGHLAACPSCRTELGACFAVDFWEQGELPSEILGKGFTARVMAAVAASPPPRTVREAQVCISHGRPALVRRARPGWQTLGNYLATCAATLILLFSGYFSACKSMTLQAARLNAGISAVCDRTGRLLERAKPWEDVWRSLQSLGTDVIKYYKGGVSK